MKRLVYKNNIEKTNNNIIEEIIKIKKKNENNQNEKMIVLGGDHSITYATFKAFTRENPDAGIIILDAHPDLMPAAKQQTHEDYLLKLIEEHILDPRKVIFVGLRNVHIQEKSFILDHKIRTFEMKKIYSLSLQSTTETIMENVVDWPALYLSIDIDVTDPAFAPGTGYCEPGGLTSRELLYIVGKLKLLRNLKMIDVVEVNPKIEERLTVSLAAEIVKEIMT